MQETNSNNSFKTGINKLNPHKSSFMRLLRNGILGLFFVGALVALFSFSNALSAQALQNSADEEFRLSTDSLNLSRASVSELTVIADRAINLRPKNLSLAAEANSNIIRKRKNCVKCKYMSAYLDDSEHGFLTETGLDALSQSYNLSPYGKLGLMKGRLEISNRNWGRLDEEHRKAALRQITAIAQHPEGRNWLKEFEAAPAPINERISRLR